MGAHHFLLIVFGFALGWVASTLFSRNRRAGDTPRKRTRAIPPGTAPKKPGKPKKAPKATPAGEAAPWVPTEPSAGPQEAQP